MNINTRTEVSDYELTEMYEQMLDECYEDVTIAGFHYSTSRALKEVDPIAFNCGEADYISSILGEQIEECFYFNQLTIEEKGIAIASYLAVYPEDRTFETVSDLLKDNEVILFKYNGEIF